MAGSRNSGHIVRNAKFKKAENFNLTKKKPRVYSFVHANEELGKQRILSLTKRDSIQSSQSISSS